MLGSILGFNIAGSILGSILGFNIGFQYWVQYLGSLLVSNIAFNIAFNIEFNIVLNNVRPFEHLWLGGKKGALKGKKKVFLTANASFTRYILRQDLPYNARLSRKWRGCVKRLTNRDKKGTAMKSKVAIHI